MKKRKELTYAWAGVDSAMEEQGMKGLLKWVRKTYGLPGERARLRVGIGYFASVVDIGGKMGLAMTTDGVGTKILVAQQMDKYDTIGIDCVAMNVNDLISVGARPIAMLDYLAVQKPQPRLLEEIGKGLYIGARQAGISIPGGEIAQLREMLKGKRRGYAFDLAGMGIGFVPLDRVVVGQNIEPGDVLVGLQSSGIHSNGLTLARRVLFDRMGYSVNTYLPQLGRTVGEELLEPTRIYVPEVMEMLEANLRIKALINITGDGFFNLVRVEAPVGYVIESLPPLPPIFPLLEELGQLKDEEMFKVFNMGVGFSVVCHKGDADKVVQIARQHKCEAFVLGYTIEDKERRVKLLPKRLIGKRGEFVKY